MNPQITELIDFYMKAGVRAWFSKDDSFDEALRTKYGGLVAQARKDRLDHLEETAEGSLALIILLDQIPRNIYRGSGDSYSSDKKAQGVAVRAISKGHDQTMGAQNRDSQMIFYLPLMHAEDILSQITCKALLENVALRLPEGSEERKTYDLSAGISKKHMECILKLGKFPARDEAMGREHRDVDREWLESHPNGW